MSRYIDADALYEKTAEWEAQALAVIEKLHGKPFEEMDVNEITEWRKWSCILNERSAFKFDVADAPTADVVEVVRCKDCKWLDEYHCCTKIEAFISGNLTFYCALGERREDEGIR